MRILDMVLAVSLAVPLGAVRADSPDAPASDGHVLTPPQLAEYAASHAGDPQAGREVFHRQQQPGCSGCHRVDGRGGEVGPDLSNVGGKLDRRLLVDAILHPSEQIVEGYRSTVVITHQGQVFTGLVKSETRDHLALLDSQQRITHIAQSEIAERHLSDISVMPDGLSADLSPQEFADVIAYLQTLRSAGQSSPGSGIVGPVDLPPGFTLSKVAGGLTGVTAMAITPDGRVLICEQTGTLRVIHRGELLPRPMLVLDIDDFWERGLIGIAVDPDFDRNGQIYVCYVRADPFPHHCISRFTVEGDTAVIESERILLEGDDQTKMGGSVPAGHQGGALHFGPDGRLYAALGEQTSGAPSQSLQSLLGKILRLDAEGTIPADNPFYGQTKGKYRAIWARGLRNPFTFAFQDETGRMLINDVGGKAEEINDGKPGRNYGWPVVEHGPTDEPEFASPIHWYPTASIAGGDFCPADSPFPEVYRGKYFFMDFVQGWIHTLDAEDTRRPIPAEPFAAGLARPVDLRFSPDGGLYVLIRDAWIRDQWFQPHTGALYRIEYSATKR